MIKETERQLSQKSYSLEKAIEMLAEVGQGTIRIGKLELEIESELDKETKSILKLSVGH